MAGWSAIFLGEATQDLERLDAAARGLGDTLRSQLANEFGDEFKAKRFTDFLEGRGRMGHLDRLEGSSFPKSFRIQLVHDHRATVFCLSKLALVVVVHVFAKTADPNYRRALSEHDRRLESYFLAFKEFADLAERRRQRRSR